jgi:hypothetical protein
MKRYNAFIDCVGRLAFQLAFLASVIGYALKKDGDAPARRYRGMLEVAIALRKLIEARNEQIENEIAAVGEYEARNAMAEQLGFGGAW